MNLCVPAEDQVFCESNTAKRQFNLESEWGNDNVYYSRW